MKKIKGLLFTLSLLVIWNTTSNAQIQEGNLMVGVNIVDIDLGFQKDNTHFGLGISPQIGYFIEDNFVLGAEVKVALNSFKNSFSIDYGLSAFSRYYLGDPRTVLLKHSRFFLEGDAGIAGRNFKTTGKPSTTTNGLGLGVGGGIAYFISPNIGLEASLKYNGIINFGTSPSSGNLNLNIGFQIYIPTTRAKEIYDEVESETKNRYYN